MKVTILANVIGAFGKITQGFLKGLVDSVVGRRVVDHPNDNIIENGQYTEKKSWRLEEICCHSNFREKTIS